MPNFFISKGPVTLGRGEGRGERNFHQVGNRKGDKWSPKDQVDLIVTKRQMMTFLNYRNYRHQLVNFVKNCIATMPLELTM